MPVSGPPAVFFTRLPRQVSGKREETSFGGQRPFRFQDADFPHEAAAVYAKIFRELGQGHIDGKRTFPFELLLIRKIVEQSLADRPGGEKIDPQGKSLRLPGDNLKQVVRKLRVMVAGVGTALNDVLIQHEQYLAVGICLHNVFQSP